MQFRRPPLRDQRRDHGGILGAETAEGLDGIFERYVKRAREIRLEEWTRRGFWHKVKDHAAYSINELL